MRSWPPISEPELLQRLALNDSEFRIMLTELAAVIGPREYRRTLYEWALGYPFVRPLGSYVWRAGEEVEPLAAMDPQQRRRTVAAFAERRHPILSFGANASPTGLEFKFSHFAAREDREALVLSGRLRDLDVGAVASPSLLGYIPATLFASPGTAVRAALVWATPAQVTQLAWAELNYRLGRLDRAAFEIDEADILVEGIFAFVARLGALCIDGAPVAMSAVEAEGRSATALSQGELLDLVARLALGRAARAEDLVRAVYENPAGVYRRAAETVWPRSRPLESPWTPYPTRS